MTATRVYKLAPKGEAPPGAIHRATTRLIQATSQAQAYGHLARSTWTATVATQVDLIELIGQGIPVEKATEEAK